MEAKFNVTIFSELKFTDDMKLAITTEGIQVECSVYNPCGLAVIELLCLDSSGIFVEYISLPSSSNCVHTIPGIFLAPCKLYTVIITLSYPGISNVSSQQSDIVLPAGGKYCFTFYFNANVTSKKDIFI